VAAATPPSACTAAGSHSAAIFAASAVRRVRVAELIDELHHASPAYSIRDSASASSSSA